MIFTLSYNFPPLNYPIGLPLGRAKEYSCDKVAHALTQDHDCKGLLMLTAGKHLYDKMDLAAYVEESVEQGGWWSTVQPYFIPSHLHVARKRHPQGTQRGHLFPQEIERRRVISAALAAQAQLA